MQEPRFQFSVQSLLLFVTCVAVALACAMRIKSLADSGSVVEIESLLVCLLFYWPMLTMSCAVGIGALLNNISYPVLAAVPIAILPYLCKVFGG